MQRLSLIDLNDLIQRSAPEDDILDFKETVDGWSESRKIKAKKIVKDVIAMANTLGGHVIIGISELDHCASQLVPQEAVVELANRLQQTTLDSIEPPIGGAISVYPILVEEGSSEGFVVIDIHESDSAPHRLASDAKDAFIRIGQESRTMSMHEIQTMVRHYFMLDERLQTQVGSHWSEFELMAKETPIALTQSQSLQILAWPLRRLPLHHRFQASDGLAGGNFFRGYVENANKQKLIIFGASYQNYSWQPWRHILRGIRSDSGDSEYRQQVSRIMDDCCILLMSISREDEPTAENPKNYLWPTHLLQQLNKVAKLIAAVRKKSGIDIPYQIEIKWHKGPFPTILGNTFDNQDQSWRHHDRRELDSMVFPPYVFENDACNLLQIFLRDIHNAAGFDLNYEITEEPFL